MITKRDEFQRAWPVVLAAAVGAGTGVSALTFYSMGAFIEPLTREMGWSRAEVTTAPIFMTTAALIMGPIAGWLADRIGTRKVAITSQILFVLGVAGIALATDDVRTFYAGFFISTFVGAGTMPITWTRAITGWFHSARGLALGFCLMGTGVMGMIGPRYATFLIDAYGWRWGYVGLAALPLFIGLPLSLLFFRDPPMAVSEHVNAQEANAWGLTAREAVCTLKFWQMAVAFFLTAAGVGGILVHGVPMLMDHGLDRTLAATIAGVLGLSVMFGRVFTGFLLDHFHGPYVAFVMLALPTFACILLLFSGDSIALNATAIMLVGLAAGAEFDIVAYFVSRYFGRKHYGAVYGLLYVIFIAGSAITPPIAGRVYDVYKTYDPAIMAGIAVFFIGALLTLTLGKYPEESQGH